MRKLLSQLADKKFDATTVPLQKNILDFYANAAAPNDTKKDPGKWQKVQNNLEALKTFTPNPAQPPAASSDTGSERRTCNSDSSAKIEEECSHCKMPASALVPACCFTEANWLIRSKEKTALVGANGTGKSTLMKVLAGLESLDYGTMQLTRGMSIGYLPQEGLRLSGRTVFDECLSVFDELRAMEGEIERTGGAALRTRSREPRI